MQPGQVPDDVPPRYNIAPTQSICCVLRENDDGNRELAKVRWGLVPSWAKDLSIGHRMINARGETVDSKPSFRKAFAQRRCLIPADGYYEWKKMDDGKQPYLIEPEGGGMLAMAGLWEENRRVAEEGVAIRTCTIITTSANHDTAAIHDRMPVFLDLEDHEPWLDPENRDTEALKDLLAPARKGSLQMTPVSRYVNSPKHDDAKCIEPVA